MSKLPDNVFRAGVGAIIVSDHGKVLAFERLKIPGAWQFPQGGLDEGEDPGDCVIREVEEETGLRAGDLERLTESTGWHAYELPRERQGQRHGRGQVQKWFVFRLKGSEEAIRLDADDRPEFRAWRWMTMDELIENTVPFRKPLYRALAKEFHAHLHAESEQP